MDDRSLETTIATDPEENAEEISTFRRYWKRYRPARIKRLMREPIPSRSQTAPQTYPQMFFSVFRRVFHFFGYSSRREFWFLHAAIILAALGPVIAVQGINFLTPVEVTDAMMLVYTIYLAVIGVIFIIPVLSVSFRRFADAGFPRWLALLHTGIPYLLGITIVNVLVIVFVIFVTTLPTAQRIRERIHRGEIEKHPLPDL